ncbi:hypothetical protein ACFYUV_34215 [Nonomuraea sp. NPDC003560]|uniref:hypothetical protein n=1 Tax=Nonomuraea sp. NPDC003560 TaxID=3364341 RepID=UPI00369D713B
MGATKGEGLADAFDAFVAFGRQADGVGEQAAQVTFAGVAVDGSRLVARDGNARLIPDVERVLGRSPRTFRTWAADHLR